MMDWAEVSAIGAACAGVGAVASLWLSHMGRDREAAVKQARDEAVAQENILKIPTMENVLNKHLLECAAANAENKIVLEQVQLTLKGLADDVKRILLKGP